MGRVAVGVLRPDLPGHPGDHGERAEECLADERGAIAEIELVLANEAR